MTRTTFAPHPTPQKHAVAGRAWPGSAWIALILFIVTAALYAPAVGYELVSYDDLGFVTKNEWVRQGLTWSNLVHAFRATEMANWHPLTWVSYLVDVTVFGSSAWGFHLTNVLLHALNSVLVFVVVRRLTGALWRSAIVAALFALHPMHVESVAWVAERKDVLCTVFWLLTTLWYLDWVRARFRGEPRAWISYFGALVSFALGLMAKPMLVTLPCVLLLLDGWPLGRWTNRGELEYGAGTPASRSERSSDGGVAAPFSWRVAASLVLEKVPFGILAALDSAITIKAQASIGAVIELTRIPWEARVENAVVSYATYLAKLFFPARLAVYYPYSSHTAAAVFLSAVILVAISIAIWRSRKSRPYLVVGWGWFLGTLVPVIGLVQVGGQAMADRYTYIPYLGLFIAIVWIVAEIVRSAPRVGVGALAVAGLVPLSALAARQLTYWRNSGTLWGHTLAVTHDNVPAHLGLGYYYSENPDRLADAIAEYRAAARLAPNHTDPHRSLAALLARRTDTLNEAVAEYETAIRLDPKYVPAYLALGAAAEQLAGHRGDAVAAYEGALRVDPNNAEAHNRLGNLLAEEPASREAAIEHFRAAIALDPSSAEIRLNLGATLADLGRFADAIAEYRQLVLAKPDFADAHNNLANALVRMTGHASEAEKEYQAAIRLKPDYIEARFNYAQLLARVLGRPADALVQLEEILRLRPDFQPAREFAAQLR